MRAILVFMFYAYMSCLFALFVLETLLFISNYEGLKQNLKNVTVLKESVILCKLAPSIKNNITIFSFLISKSLNVDNYF